MLYNFSDRTKYCDFYPNTNKRRVKSGKALLNYLTYETLTINAQHETKLTLKYKKGSPEHQNPCFLTVVATIVIRILKNISC